MLTDEMKEILSRSRRMGWVLEPEAKRLFSLAGLDIPQFTWARSVEEALRFCRKNGYPVVGKVVSPEVIHKSDVGGVIVGIDDDRKLSEAFHRLSQI